MNGTQETTSGFAAEQQPSQPMAPPPMAPPVGASMRAQDPREKSPALACILSAMPGLGQVYVGYYQRGFVHVIVVAGLIAILNGVRGDNPLTPLLGLFLAFFWLYNIIDGGRRASLYNQVLAGTENIAPPSDFKMPGIRGSFFGGLALIVAGAILLSNTKFGVPLDWVEQWWPLVPILFGVFLVGKAMQERMGAGSRDEE